MRTGVRSEWSSIPAHVRAHVDELLGSRVVEATNLNGGFSPGPAARYELADGRRVFVKAAGSELNPVSPGMHRSEAAVLASLPPDHPAPTLIGVVDDGDWVALVVEWVDGHTPNLPLATSGWKRMLAVAHRLAIAGEGCRPDGILPFEERHPDLTGHWQRLAAGEDDGVDRLDSWSSKHLDRLAALDAGSADAARGNTLLQLDLRTDNVLFSPLGAEHDVVVDWPSAVIGAAWIDLVTMLPALHLDGAPAPHELFDEHPLARGADADAVTTFLAGFAGYFTRQALEAPPPGLPTLRAFQAEQGRVARVWLAQRLDLEPS